MTTARITQAEHNEIVEKFSEMLGRIINANPCPLTPDEMIQAWENTLPEDYVAAYRTMERYARTSQEKTNRADLPLRQKDGTCITVRLHIGGYGNHSKNHTEKFAIYRHEEPVPLAQMDLPAERLESFVEWMQLAPLLLARNKCAYSTIEDLLRMASTVGQVKRMAPELVYYMSDRYKAAANEQQRRSPLSPEWSMYPRAAVKECIDTLAICHLLPPGRRQVAYVEDIPWANTTGVKDDAED